MKLTGGILKRLREKNNKNLEELVTDINEKYNVDFNVNKIAKWESGKGKFIYDDLKCFALYYNVTTDFLLGFDLDEFVDIIDLRDDLEIMKMHDEFIKGLKNITPFLPLIK